MRSLSIDRLQLIEALVAQRTTGEISAALLEKDEHLTAALRAVFDLHFEHAKLVLCGGTSLVKAHRIIERMSEDADIKVALSPYTASWSNTQRRRYLGDEVRTQVIAAMVHCGFRESIGSRVSLNQNRYFCSQWEYGRRYDGALALRPLLRLELTARTPVLPTVTAALGPLANSLVSDSSTPMFSPAIISVSETLAEKVLSFLRRFAAQRNHRDNSNWDDRLVRHIYDVHCIRCLRPDAQDAALEAFALITANEVNEVGYQDAAFARDPRQTLELALSQIESDSSLRDDYDRMLLPLVYGVNKYSFDESIGSFTDIAKRLITSL